MPETSFTSFPALSDGPRVRISRSASETNVRLFFFPITITIIIYHSSFLSFFDSLRRIRNFSERHSVFFVVVQKLRHF